MKNFISIVFLLTTHYLSCQALTWETFVDSIPTLSSPRSCDLNNDGFLDIIIGGGTEGESSNFGVMAFDGIDGSLLWNATSRSELYGSPIFYDINSDGTDDVFITGREAQFLAFDGTTGSLLWDFSHMVQIPRIVGGITFIILNLLTMLTLTRFKILL